jgi:Holliday junction DNA helicase RuvA
MIAYLNGTIFNKTTQSVIIQNAGIGYEVHVPLSTFYGLPEKNEQVGLHIHTHVKEDALTLFGFQTVLEKQIFLLLIAVTGIGPKLAVNILSGIGPDDLLAAMARGDALRLQAIPGVGKKTAERIALELKEKATAMVTEAPEIPAFVGTESGRQDMDDAVSALVNLGYSAKAATKSVEKALTITQDGNLEQLIKEALKILA